MLEQVTKQNFQQLLDRFTTGELENLLEKFPYFRQAHVLLAKKYQQENNPKFDQQLQLAAIYIQDREMLFDLFNEKDPDSPISTPGFKKLVEEIQQQANAIQQEEPVRTEPGIEEEIVAVQEKAEEISEEVSFAAEEEIVPAELSLTPTIQEEEKETFSTHEPHTFDDWLKAFGQSGTVEVKQEEEPEVTETVAEGDELDKLIMESVSSDYLHNLVEEETHYSKGLDKFIEEQIQKHKHEIVTKPAPENELDAELITETMAKVYEMQKKYSRAIKAYEILALKIPEKNDFFAARINYLKNII